MATKNAKIQDRENQVNVSLVLDCSGSMDGFKIEKVKIAMKKFVEGLDDNDILSIISFDDRAKVVLGAKKIGNDKTMICKMIDGIYGGGSTNINDGMMLGYQEAVKNQSKNTNSRVILLTDGMTNSGETNPEKIISNSKTYNDKGIEISTIGVGDQLDFDLLRQLSDAGNGSNYFIGENEEDIQKTFVDELQSLLFQIGKRPNVIIELPKNLKIKEFYGYRPQFLSDNKVSLNIENLNSGVTQIFLLKVEKESDANAEIKVQLNYSKNDKNISLEEIKNYKSKIESTNNELKKNYQIALMASNLKKACAEYSKNNFGNADSLIKETIDYVQLNSDLKDKDINRLFFILKRLDTKRPVN